jgi:alanine or glycine:cation symporter, AGCS family
MEELNSILSVIDSNIGGASWFVYLLLGTGVFFTIYLRFPQFRYFAHAIRIVRGKYDKKGDEGDASHFQALATALSGTVGTGNIAGVALAIHLGGPAAIFWMLVTALLGMTTKFVEVTLSHKYREKTEDGSISGGPMYYMKNKLNMKWMAAIFAIATVISSFGTGNLPQINSISNSIFATFGIDQMITGGVLAVILGFVIIGGIKRIASVTEKLVPVMAIIYVIGALGVILYNYENIIPSFQSIFADIFTGSSATGGFLGASIAFAFNRGVNRGLFSNEAGQGSAPIAHAAARANEPVSEGMVSILEPFIDTVVICTLTGLVLLSSGVWNQKVVNQFQMADLEVLNRTYQENSEADRQELSAYLRNEGSIAYFNGELDIQNGVIQNEVTLLNSRSIAEEVKVAQNGSPYTGAVAVSNGRVNDQGGAIVFEGSSLLHSAPLTAEAFKRGILGDFGQYIIAIGLLLFAFSTAISWSYYGSRAMTYLFGSSSIKYYNVFYVIAFFFGAFTDTTIVWTLAGIAIALMTIPNLIGILLLRKDMKQTVDQYWEDFNKEHGEKEVVREKVEA